jgi:Recombinase zinc beta ribbon domain
MKRSYTKGGDESKGARSPKKRELQTLRVPTDAQFMAVVDDFGLTDRAAAVLDLVIGDALADLRSYQRWRRRKTGHDEQIADPIEEIYKLLSKLVSFLEANPGVLKQILPAPAGERLGELFSFTGIGRALNRELFPGDGKLLRSYLRKSAQQFDIASVEGFYARPREDYGLIHSARGTRRSVLAQVGSRHAQEKRKALLQSRNPKRTPPRVVNGPTFLAGLARCGYCGAAMIQNTGKGGLYRYYCCSSKLKKGPSACRGLRTPMEKLDEIVIGEVVRQVLDPDRLTAMLDGYVQSAVTQADGAKAQLAKLRHDHAAATAGIARRLELVEKGLMEAEDPAMRERLVTLKLQRDQIAKEIGELQNRMASSVPSLTPEKVARIGGLLRDKLYEGPAEFRQAYARLLMDEVRVTDNPHQRTEIGSREVRGKRGSRTRAESSLFCSRVARPKRFELPTPRFIDCDPSCTLLLIAPHKPLYSLQFPFFVGT